MKLQPTDKGLVVYATNDLLINKVFEQELQAGLEREIGKVATNRAACATLLYMASLAYDVSALTRSQYGVPVERVLSAINYSLDQGNPGCSDVLGGIERMLDTDCKPATVATVCGANITTLIDSRHRLVRKHSLSVMTRLGADHDAATSLIDAGAFSHLLTLVQICPENDELLINGLKTFEVLLSGNADAPQLLIDLNSSAVGLLDMLATTSETATMREEARRILSILEAGRRKTSGPGASIAERWREDDAAARVIAEALK